MEKAWREPRQPAEDQRLPGEAFCEDCPDHEACWTGWPCWKVRLVDAGGNPDSWEWLGMER